MRKYNTEAIVLKNINYSDADKIYTLLTQKYGKIAAIAKGVRRISSRRAGNLDSLNHVSLGIYEGSSKFKSIVEVKTISAFKDLKKSLERSLSGYYMAELINKSLEEDSEAGMIFDLLRIALGKLNDLDNQPDEVVNSFEIKLMRLLGYQIPAERLKSMNKKELDRRIKSYIREILGEKFKSLEI